MRKLSMMFILFMFAFSTFLTGCMKSSTNSASNSSPSVSPAQSNDKASAPPAQVNLRYATWTDGDQLKIEQGLIKNYETAHPNIKVSIDAWGDGYDQKLAAAIGANDSPDVLMVWDFPTYYKALEPLDNMVNADADLNLDDMYPGLLNYDKINGQLYGIPTGYTTRAIYYNKKLFDDAAIPYPAEGWTWDDFNQYAKKLTNPATKQFGFAIPSNPGTYSMEQFLWSDGGSFISPDGKQIEGFANGKEAVDVLTMFQNMVKNKTAVLVGGKNQQSGDDIFKSGKLAMWESGTWPMESFKKAGLNFGTVILPAFPGKKVQGVVHEGAYSISNTSKQKQEAWNLAKYLVSSEVSQFKVLDMQVRKSSVKELKKDEDPYLQAFYHMIDYSNQTPAFLLNPNWNEIDKNLGTALNAIMLGGDVKQNLDKAVKDSAKFLNK
jgi:multiple sugar transport system substrate-binding protein